MLLVPARLLSWLNRLATSPRLVRLAFPGLPVALCMAVLASMGPILQQFAEVALTDGRAEAVEYGEIYRFLTWRERFVDAGGYLFAFAGLVAGFAASRRRTPITIATAAAFWLWGLICAIDLTASKVNGSQQASSFGMQTLFNAVGAVAAGVVLAPLLCLAVAADRVWDAVPRRAAMQAAIIAIGGLLMAGTTYVMIAFAHRPAPSWMEVTSGLPISGWAIGGAPRDAMDANRTLSWLPSGGVIGHLSAQTVKRRYSRGELWATRGRGASRSRLTNAASTRKPAAARRRPDPSISPPASRAPSRA